MITVLGSNYQTTLIKTDKSLKINNQKGFAQISLVLQQYCLITLSLTVIIRDLQFKTVKCNQNWCKTEKTVQNLVDWLIFYLLVAEDIMVGLLRAF